MSLGLSLTSAVPAVDASATTFTHLHMQHHRSQSFQDLDKEQARAPPPKVVHVYTESPQLLATAHSHST